MVSEFDPDIAASNAVGLEAGLPSTPADGPSLRSATPGEEVRRRRRRHSFGAGRKAALVAWDALVPAVVASALIAVGGGDSTGGTTDELRYGLLLAALAPPGLALAGAYDHQRFRQGGRLALAGRMLIISMLLSWTWVVAADAAGWESDPSRLLVAALLLPLGWLIGRGIIDLPSAAGAERVLLLGSGTVADRVLDLASRQGRRPFELVGRLDDVPRDDGHSRLPLLGGLDDLPQVLADQRIDRVVVAFRPGRDSALVDGLRQCLARGVPVDVVPRFFDLVGPRPRGRNIGGLSLIEVPGRGLRPSQRAGKRAFDIICAAALLLAFLPLIAVVAAFILILDGRPVLFRQTRVGRGGRPFTILKFRTMRQGLATPEISRRARDADHSRDSPGLESISSMVRDLKVADGARTTRVGRFLRTTSMDEIPQLINVLRGDMSLVGPRPLRPFEAASLAPWQLARQELRPGLTGLWQVLGRSGIDWDERMQMDYSYVAHWSFASDVRILARTLPAVLRREGAV
jgi:exopolysaccharide biosynthesis polyprenyl glycosylphosphotransferase